MHGLTTMNESRTASTRAELRLLVGFTALPPAAGLLMFVVCLTLWSTGAWIFEGTPSLEAAVSLGIGVGIVGVIVTVFGAVPAVTWLIRRGQLSLRNMVLLGGVLGNVPFAVVIVSILATQFARGTPSPDVGQLWFGWYGAIRAIILGLWFGIALATLLWAVAVRGSVLERADGPRS